MSNDTIKVSGWITDGAPAKYGVVLATDEVLLTRPYIKMNEEAVKAN